ncbi:bifunctional hydroxymethylpyrimidine kinase/phosphomethylpyrimidine kinase [Nocardioides sp. KIGAM211]|uniref:Bifunctional hydroxymethylpyrimidine kinase/phosphomethylpyrimidine kinase n=1 Tax=Nocardioides luti TaxID=2761101 RepID=A0A7X0RGQ6_9ACTN|nr:carbohydrate kinase [Nocardioides luti]MBB6627999.1 bifunctional hydroxymethylpyrimidine kinase/phosphomethylpyrimidine kinase [Nocardioides luti]
MSLTDREQEIVALLRRDPLIGSEAIADALGTTRQAVNVHLSNLGKKGVILGRGYVLSEAPAVVVIGGANMDVKARSTRTAVVATSNPGTGSMAPGGVGRNIAENLARLGTRTHLVAAIGSDALGDQVLAATSAAGVHVEHVRRSARATGTYTAVLDATGELVVAVADMTATDELGPDRVNAARDLVTTAGLLVLDGNLAPDTLAFAVELAAAAGVRTVLEPVSVPKAAAAAHLVEASRPLFAITPNRDELAALTGLRVGTDRQVRAAARQLHDRGVTHVWVRLGARGSLLSSPDGEVALAAVPADVVDVTGAGDALLAAFCHGILAGDDPAAAAAYAHAAAALTIASTHTVRPDLTDRLVRTRLKEAP